jgi:hypothetical protein
MIWPASIETDCRPAPIVAKRCRQSKQSGKNANATRFRGGIRVPPLGIQAADLKVQFAYGLLARLPLLVIHRDRIPTMLQGSGYENGNADNSKQSAEEIPRRSMRARRIAQVMRNDPRPDKDGACKDQDCTNGTSHV